ncbi:MAG TPA: hypothetical protein VN419_13880 [Humidesulfovibrio sp.]|uniref:hypothetical protein n=1 Tax=Humidesulfovibrio sp. TaxID=2910988 RepID=UPI002BB5CE7A|nr:hypothetical protein [Humidesulfovibrio sp.]HWR05090.1 hypothetical protein [Humidesulfovibrio sp.]
MSIDTAWNMQGITALDLSAMSASESIVNASQDTNRDQPQTRTDFLGGATPPLLDITELTLSHSTVSDGPGFPLHVSGAPTDYDSGMIRPVAATPEGGPQEMAQNYLSVNQLDQSFASNLAAQNYTDSYLGRIVDYTA